MAYIFIHLAGLYLIDEKYHVLLECSDVFEALVDAHLHIALHAMSHMLECLLGLVGAKHAQHIALHACKHALFVALPVASHGSYHAFEQKYVFHLCHIGHKYSFVAQIFHLALVAAVAVHYAAAVEVVKRLQLIERPCGFYHLVAAAHRLHGVFLKHECIQFRVDAMHAVAFDEKYRFAAAEQVYIQFLA